MDTYDPLRTPDATDWTSLDEDVRISLVVEHHRRAAVELPNETLHATMHIIVENQLAAIDQPVIDALERLMRQGLDRHDSIHAIGSVVAGHLHSLLGRKDPRPVSHERYYARLRKLTAKRWLKGKW